MAEKLNHSNPLRAPDGLAFPLPSSFSRSNSLPRPDSGKIALSIWQR
jgi:hypothetical protein